MNSLQFAIKIKKTLLTANSETKIWLSYR